MSRGRFHYGLDQVTKPAFSKRGFYHRKLLTDWPQIVGEVLAKASHPKKLIFPKGENTGGTLYIEVYHSGLATELTYLEPMVLEKIAMYFGYRAVGALKLIQKPEGMVVDKKESIYEAKQTPSEATIALVAEVEDEVLREHLLSLGSRLSDVQGQD